MTRRRGNQENVKALRGYFAREHGKVALLNQLMGLWASGRIPDAASDATNFMSDAATAYAVLSLIYAR
jgi:hypothetical protein